MTTEADYFGPGRQPLKESARLSRHAAAASVAVALILTLTKAGAWAMSDSVSLLSSLADSALDVAASLITFGAIAYAATPPDAEHRFGHGKAEGLSALFQAALVLISATLVAREAVGRFIDPQPIDHGAVALAVTLFALVLTGGLIAYQSRVVRRTGSVAVGGDRAHYMSDFMVNGAVIVGVALGAFAGLERADAAIGFLVAVWLAIAAINVARSAFDLLLDRELPDSARAQILALAKDDPRILGVHQLRTHASGAAIRIQFHIDLDPAISLQAAHEILVAAEKRILAQFPAADILIHPDPRGRAEPHGPELAARREAG